ILPNCDPGHTSPLTNPNCNGKAPFLDPTTHSIVNTGVIGETITLKPGSSAPTPGQYYAVDLPVASGGSFLCPSCAGGGSSSSNGAALYRQNIQCCNSMPLTCGNLTISLQTGNMQGHTRQGVQCHINEGNNGTG